MLEQWRCLLRSESRRVVIEERSRVSITRVVGCCEDLGRSSSDRSGLDETAKPNLPAGWALEENQFVGPTPMPEDALDIIRDTIGEIDFWGMAQYYDNGD